MLRKQKRKAVTIAHSSVVLHLAPILAARNINHPSAFLIKMGISTVTATKILKGKAVQITFKQLTLLCLHLNCTPNDLFALRDLVPPVGHQLEKLQSISDAVINPVEKYKNMGLEEIKKL